VSSLIAKVQKLGAIGLDSVRYVGGLGFLCLDTLRWTLRGLVGQPWIDLSGLSFQMVRVGVKAVGIVVLVHFFLGMILSFEMAPVLKNYGMLSQLATIIVKAVFPQLGPIFSAIVLSGFAGAAIAAELGTMVVAEEIQALQAMALNPVRFLVVPRVLACVVMLVCLTIIADLAAWVGGLLVYAVPLQKDAYGYYMMATQELLVRDVVVGLIKSAFFAALVSIIACYEGLRVTGGAEGVGRATTRSVVFAIVGIIVCNLVLTVFFYYFWPIGPSS